MALDDAGLAHVRAAFVAAARRAARLGMDVVELHQIMVSLGMFNVSNQYTFGAIFERDPSSPAQLARTRELACEVVLRFLAA